MDRSRSVEWDGTSSLREKLIRVMPPRQWRPVGTHPTLLELTLFDDPLPDPIPKGRSDPPAGNIPAMNNLAPFLWFNDNAEEAADFYLSVFPHARKLGELRSQGVGPWPVGKIATITIELEGQEMVFLNGGPAHQLSPAFSFFVRCDSQQEIDNYWDKLMEGGGKPMACGWLTDRFRLCWQVVPRNIGELVSHPKAMAAMMGMIKMDLPALEAAAKENN